MTQSLPAVRAEPVRLGLMAPLTGLASLYARDIVHAAQVACAAVNAAGGVLGRPLELVVADDGTHPQTAVPAALDLAARGCVALIGNLMSNARIAVATQVAEPLGIPLLNFSFYEGSISGRHFFHFAALPNQQIDRMIPYMARRFGGKMFFAGHNYEWPRGSMAAAKASLARAGGEAVGEAYLGWEFSDVELDRLLGQLDRIGTDVFVPYFAGADQVRILTRLHELGLSGTLAVVMGHFDEVMAGQLRPEVRDGLFSCNTYFMSLPCPENQAFLRELQRLPEVDGLWPGGNGVATNFGAGVYVCVQAFVQAVERACATDATGLVAALERSRVLGPYGWVTMDAATHHAHVNTWLARCRRDGSFELLEHFGCQAPEIPRRYAERAKTPRQLMHTGRLPAQPHGLGAEELSHAMARLSHTALVACDEWGRIAAANSAAHALFGYPDGELPNLPLLELVPPHLRGTQIEHATRLLADHAAGHAAEISGMDALGYRRDGSFVPLLMSMRVASVGVTRAVIHTLVDMTDRKRLEDELRRRASHDALTGLPNRTLLFDRLGRALQRAQASGSPVAVLFIDLDGFKLVNDVHGHATGDLVLRTVADRLVACAQRGQTVARLAGDEFVVIIEHALDTEALGEQAGRILAELREPVYTDEATVALSACVGIAWGRRGHTDAEAVMQQADAAMYAAKQRGRDRWQAYSAPLRDAAQHRLRIARDLRGALDRSELSLLVQPIVTMADGRIIGGELLLRWARAIGEVGPAEFVPVAESTGEIVPIGAWVLRQACGAQARWRQAWGERAPYLAVNVSARQLAAAGLAAELRGWVSAAGADPRQMVVEVTETALMRDYEQAMFVVKDLAEQGMRIAVDDFGTGCSSLARLIEMPVTMVKVDRRFVRDIAASEACRTVTTAVLGMARTLGLEAVAEGVESEAQRDHLVANGCTMAQGYLFGRPMDPDAFVDTVAAQIAAAQP
ncbi:MAG: EAL domain-containing protein [Deltaproteobacteria bacterium]|nr:EAL domain-containing protein [Deltaproteobacteria bacterium]